MKKNDFENTQDTNPVMKSIRDGVEKCFKTGKVKWDCKYLTLRPLDDEGNPMLDTLISIFSDRIALLVYERGIEGARHAFDREKKLSKQDHDK